MSPQVHRKRDVSSFAVGLCKGSKLNISLTVCKNLYGGTQESGSSVRGNVSIHQQVLRIFAWKAISPLPDRRKFSNAWIDWPAYTVAISANTHPREKISAAAACDQTWLKAIETDTSGAQYFGVTPEALRAPVLGMPSE
jgi:hypothetical protein